MKIVDIADEIFRELGEPSDLVIPAISYWVRSNIGILNNYLNKAFEINETTLEIIDGSKHEITVDEAVVLKKMYVVYYYDTRIRKNLGVVEKETIIAVSDEGTSVTKINKNQVTVALTSLKRAEEAELQRLITAYKLDKSKPRQVAGDDTEKGNFGQTKYNSNFNRIN